MEKKSVRELRDICAKEGLSRLGTKSELIKRLGSFKNDDSEGRRVVNWNERGRKVKKPVEIVVDDDPESLDSDEYGNLKKEELKKVCLDRNLPTTGTVKALVKRLQENDVMKKEVEKASDGIAKNIKCESCEENPTKLYSITSAKWYCYDCKEHICNLCKEAHEKIKCTRTHVITPYGSLLEQNIEKNLTITVNDAIVVAEAPVTNIQFLDFTLTDDEYEETDCSKRKRDDDDNDDDEEDLNNSQEIIYQTPMAQIRCKSNKRLIVDFVPETPANFVNKENETVSITPPPTFLSPVQRCIPVFATVSPIETFVAESPDNLEVSRDMFAESPTVVPETPLLPPVPPPQPVGIVRNFIETQPITPARLQGQRWRNWANTRLAHIIPPNLRYTDEEVRAYLPDDILDVHDTPVEAVQVVQAEPPVEAVQVVQAEPEVTQEEQTPPEREVNDMRNVITAKPTKEKKRKLVYEVPEDEKVKCNDGKWSKNHQGGEVYCVDGFSYLINNHCISKKTGFLTLYLICSKCGGRNILINGKIKKPDHPGHTCSPDPDNWDILEAENRLKSLGE